MVFFPSHLHSNAYWPSASSSVLAFCGSRKVTTCGFVRIIIKWLVQYKRPLYTCPSKRGRGLSPAVGTFTLSWIWTHDLFDEIDLSDLCVVIVCFAIADESQIPCLPSLANVFHTPSPSFSICLPLHPSVLPLITVSSFFSTHYLPNVCSLLAHLPPPHPAHNLSPLSALFSLSEQYPVLSVSLLILFLRPPSSKRQPLFLAW